MEINVKSENQSGGNVIGQVVGGTVVEQARGEPPKQPTPTSFWKRLLKDFRGHLIVAILMLIVTAVLGYNLYQDRKEPKGLQINLGEKGLSIEKK